MELYLIRHADAAPVGQNGVLDDALRPLTPKGQEQSKAVGHGLVRRGVRVPMVVASPLLRARQTAEGIAQALAERLDDQRLHLLEQAERLVRAEEEWRGLQLAALAELEEAARRLQGVPGLSPIFVTS